MVRGVNSIESRKRLPYRDKIDSGPWKWSLLAYDCCKTICRVMALCSVEAPKV